MGINLKDFFNLDEVVFSEEELNAAIELHSEGLELTKINKFAENISSNQYSQNKISYKQQPSSPFYKYQNDLLEAS